MKLWERLATPAMEYRPGNYWGWMENITPEESRWQVKEMASVGLGGYVMHARGGLEVPYMGQQWMDSVAAIIDEGKQHGMMTIVDDEHGWPSGFGAGIVTAKGKAYWLKWLVCLQGDDALPDREDTLALYGYTPTSLRRVDDFADLKSGETAVRMAYDFSQYYVDNMDPQVVAAFIECSYQVYFDKFGKELGENGWWGIFSDEPQMCHGRVPWSWTLPEAFKAAYGADILDFLPAVMLPVQGAEYDTFRYRYFASTNRQFTNSYGRQIGEWCQAHKVGFTGHTMLEDHLPSQTLATAGTMPFYEYMDMPGIDWLNRIPVHNPTLKQLTSASQQFGKQRILSEMYGCAGWNVSMEELKWIGDWHFVSGVNYMLQHLGLYSLKGSRKREFPASLYYQQPWWSRFGGFNDYAARLSQLTTETRPLINVLMLHPMHSAWMAFAYGDQNAVRTLDQQFAALTDGLLYGGIDIHYGDEDIMAKHGRVVGSQLRVAEGVYDAVVLPPIWTVEPSTLALLKAYQAAGGLVISAGRLPTALSGVPSQEVTEWAQQLPQVAEGDIAALKQQLPQQPLGWSGTTTVMGCTREDADGHYYFLFNTSQTQSQELQIAGEGEWYRLRLEDGAIERASRNWRLEPMESVLFFAPNQSLTAPETNHLGNMPTGKTESLSGAWKVVSNTPNALTLDTCAYSFEGGAWEKALPVVALQQRMLKGGKNGQVAMSFTFTAKAAPQGELYVVLEEPEKCSVRINGKSVDMTDQGWWVDKSFRKLRIDGMVQVGANEIIVERPFYCSERTFRIRNDPTVHEAESNRVTVETELEAIYLLGDFSVDTEIGRDMERRAMFVPAAFTVNTPKEEADIADLVQGGFPFFAGEVTLEKEVLIPAGKRVYFAMNTPDAIFTELKVNGKMVKSFQWAPYRVEITDEVRAGANTIAVTLVNSNRNLLGPLHHTNGENYGVGPHTFVDEKHWTDEYCFVRFGIEGAKLIIE